MEETAIKITGVSKKYSVGASKDDSLRGHLTSILSSAKSKTDSFWALKDVSFEVKKGEVIGIIGKNGAGKSTLLKILSQITKPTEGKIEINGRVASLLEVGTGFHPELTGRENIYLNGTILGMTRKEVRAKFDEIVEFSGVKKFIDTPVKHYSSGMYVRLARGRTVLFVSHNMQAVNMLCPKSVLLVNGKLEYIGKSHEAIRRYQNLTNDLKNEWVGDEGDDCVRLLQTSVSSAESDFYTDEDVFIENLNLEKLWLILCMVIMMWKREKSYLQVVILLNLESQKTHLVKEIIQCKLI